MTNKGQPKLCESADKISHLQRTVDRLSLRNSQQELALKLAGMLLHQHLLDCPLMLQACQRECNDERFKDPSTCWVGYLKKQVGLSDG